MCDLSKCQDKNTPNRVFTQSFF